MTTSSKCVDPRISINSLVENCGNAKGRSASVLFSHASKKTVIISVLVGSLVAGIISALVCGILFGPLGSLLGFLCGAVVGACIGYAFTATCKQDGISLSDSSTQNLNVHPYFGRDTDDIIHTTGVRLDALGRSLGIESSEQNLGEEIPSSDRETDEIISSVSMRLTLLGDRLRIESSEG